MPTEIEIKRGSTFSQTCLCVDELDTPIDLSLWSFESDLKLVSSNEKLVTFSIDDSAAAARDRSACSAPLVRYFKFTPTDVDGIRHQVHRPKW